MGVASWGAGNGRGEDRYTVRAPKVPVRALKGPFGDRAGPLFCSIAAPHVAPHYATLKVSSRIKGPLTLYKL
eukprot:9491052-Pyramimonas_sp.AAC.1